MSRLSPEVRRIIAEGRGIVSVARTILSRGSEWIIKAAPGFTSALESKGAVYERNLLWKLARNSLRGR